MFSRCFSDGTYSGPTRCSYHVPRATLTCATRPLISPATSLMGGKKVRGRKRHYLVDVEGHLLLALVGPADEDDREGARWLLRARDQRWPRLELLWGDQHYTGDLEAEARAEFGIRLEVVRKPEEQRGFVVLPRRWVVERTIAWLHQHRRLRVRYERRADIHEAFLYLGASLICFRQLQAQESFC